MKKTFLNMMFLRKKKIAKLKGKKIAKELV